MPTLTMAFCWGFGSVKVLELGVLGFGVVQQPPVPLHYADWNRDLSVVDSEEGECALCGSTSSRYGEFED